MVIPLGDRNTQVMTSIKRVSDTSFERTAHGNFMFVPMLPGTAGQ